MQTFTTITNFEYYETLQADAAEGETCWTINKNARPGDTVLLYVCAPVSAIVATAVVAEVPYQDEKIKSEFFGLYFAEMNNLQMLDVPLTRKRLLAESPEWRYWMQPRNSILVKPEFLPKLEKLLGRKSDD